MSKETGGPAFPDHGGQYDYTGGMTLRDYFAAKAMQGTLTNHEWNHWSTEQHVEYAYGVADAMLKARNQ
ncbi:hypothetical protein F0336_14240 [Serratia liquefaciens]|uniref:hypothetical protein n=1 Tax=Serratia liquefaciens TaxID=614 RepID=UPI0011F0B28A|nr:hypothetical protein [Serratia liquefaciens]QIC87537.1 hypothetical protein F0336_14240 [Serratia liquefaciens]